MACWWNTAEKDLESVLEEIGPRRCDSTNWAYDVVKFRVEGRVAYVKLDDVKGANGLSGKFSSALMDIGAELHRRKDIKVVSITASGPYFCTGGAFAAGQDEDAHLYARPVPSDATEDEAGVIGNKTTSLSFWLLNTIPQLKVAAIRGTSMGAGNSLISTMDYVISPEKKMRMSFKEATRGLAACTSWQGIMAKAGVPMTRRLALISDEIDANDAKKYGFVDEIITGGDTGDQQNRANERSDALALEFSKLSDDEIMKMKKTGPGCRTPLMKIPQGAKGTEAAKQYPPNFKEAVEQVIRATGRSGRPAAARLSDELWKHDVVSIAMSGSGVATIQLKRPEAGNRINKDMVRGLIDAVIELHRSVGRVRLVCFRAEGGAFCSGLDEDLKADDKKLNMLLFLIWMLPMYTIGIVEGSVEGHGLALCSTFDSILCGSGATFSFKDLKLGGATEFLEYRFQAEALKDHINAGKIMSAEEATECLFATHAFADNASLKEKLNGICAQVTMTAPNAIAGSKAFQQLAGTNSLDLTTFEPLNLHIARRMVDPEFNDSIAAISIPGYVPKYAQTPVIMHHEEAIAY